MFFIIKTLDDKAFLYDLLLGFTKAANTVAGSNYLQQ